MSFEECSSNNLNITWSLWENSKDEASYFDTKSNCVESSRCRNFSDLIGRIKLLILVRYKGKTNFEVQQNLIVTLHW